MGAASQRCRAVPTNAVFELLVPSFPNGRFSVVSFQGEEAISRPYSFEILTTAIGIDNSAFERDILGQRGSLVMATAAHTSRFVHGVFRHISAEGVSGAAEDQHHYRFWLAPRFELLSKNKNSRIFQDQTVQQIIARILDESHVAHRFELVRTYAPRNYCVQYQETDKHFIERLLAEEGICYFFEHANDERGNETIHFMDDVTVARPFSEDSLLHFRDSGGMSERENDVRRFQKGQQVKPRSTLLREFDWLRPSLELAAGATLNEEGEIQLAQQLGNVSRQMAFGLAGIPNVSMPGIPNVPSVPNLSASDVMGGVPGGGSTASSAGAVANVASSVSGVTGGIANTVSSVANTVSSVANTVSSVASAIATGAFAGPPSRADTPLYRVYEHQSELEQVSVNGPMAQRELESHRRNAVIAEAETRNRMLLPGHSFELHGAAIAAHDGHYLVVRIQHEGHHPEAVRSTSGKTPDIYKNRVWSVPMGTVYRPRRPKRRANQVVETATVVGPPGHEIHTDSHGRIKVQFHWDRHGRFNEHSSCFIRVMQAWAGAAWGAQFIPRIGMEVIVSFVGGDTDRPIVLGCVYNAEHPAPFTLPREKTKSGIRTQSTRRGAGGYNELSFEDRLGHELLHLHAQKDLETIARHNHTARVGVNMTEQVGGNRFSVVGANQVEAVGGNATVAVGGDEQSTVDGSSTTRIRKDASTAIDGSLQHRVAADVHSEIHGEHRHSTTGETQWTTESDVLLRLKGSLVQVVGTHGANRSYALHVEGQSELSSTDETVIRSDKAIVISCGESHIRIGPKSVEVDSPKVLLQGKGGQIVIADDKVKLRAKKLIGAKSDDKVALYGSAALLVLTSEAKLDGSSVKLKASDSSYADEEREEGETTTIELVDQDGNPIPNQRYRILLEGDVQISGVLDAEGKATVRIPSGGEIVFPDLGPAESA